MLNFIYYPVSAIMWFWHQAFGFLFGQNSGASWALSVVFLVFTLRAILYKPFVGQVRSMRKMQQFQPEIQKLKKKYGNDRQKMAAEMQKLQREQGVNPVGGCLPVLIQVPVFIGLFHVLREFKPGKTENYVFGPDEVASFNNSHLFGAKLGAWVTQGPAALQAAGTSITDMLVVMIPLMIAAGIFTHITARHSVARQVEAQAGNPQAAIMNKLMLYVFPVGVVVGAPFFPLAILFYWVSNNLWTLGQQYVVYKRIDVEETVKREEADVARQARAPRPGQKPERDGDAPVPPVAATTADGAAATVEGGSSNGHPVKKPGAKPVEAKAKVVKPDGKTGSINSSGASRNGRSTGGGSRPSTTRRGRKRR